MRYLSPIRFYAYCNIDTEDTTSLSVSRLKKLITAEFAIASEGLITIEGYNYNKNDLLLDLENPNWEEHIKYHLLIWNTKSLLKFLEEDTIRIMNAKKEWFRLSEDVSFVNFVSPYFAESYNIVMKRNYNPVTFDDAKFWFLFLSFVTPEDEETALASTRAFLDDTISLFSNINKTTHHSRAAEIRPWTFQAWQHYLNTLPDSIFYYKETVASAIVGFTAEIAHTDTTMAYYISTRLSKLTDLSPSLNELIQSNHSVLSRADTQIQDSQNTYDDDGGGGGGSCLGQGFSGLFVVIVIIRLILAFSR